MKTTFFAFGERVATWRTRWPAAELRRRGHDVAVDLDHPGPETSDDVTYVLHLTNKAWRGPNGAVVTYLDLARIFAAAGRLMLSVDDDWSRMMDVQADRTDPYARRVHAEVPELVATADRVIVATPRLAEVFGAFNDDVVVCENYLPEWVIDLAPAPPLEVIAWMGEMNIHGQDWNALQPYAPDLPPLRLIGAGEHARNMLRKWGAREVGATDAIFDQRKLYREMGRAVGAIVPLQDTPFNRGKSWIKPMEFLARGVPVVSSWHPEYERLDALIGEVPTFVRPVELVSAAVDLWENRRDASELPARLRDEGLTMERAGGDQWEKALL